MIDVAVTGLGVLSGFGHGVAPFWAGLCAGESALRPVARFPLPAGLDAVGEVPDLEPRAYARTPLGRRIDRTSLLALGACRLALADAGEPLADVDPARVGLGLGSALGNFGETSTFLDRLFSSGTGNPLVFANLVMNAPLSYASIELGITGATAFLTEQEASGEAAIAWAAQLVADGRADVCLAGGADELDRVVCEALADARVFGRGRPRPFDARADGVVPGEGAAVLVLEPLTRARARGARVYALVRPHPGFAVPAPVHGWSREPAAVADGLAPVLRDVDVVVAAAGGEPARDGLEEAALLRALGGPAAVTAPRAALGDFGTAGALGAAVAALALAEGVVPPAVDAGPSRLDVVRGAARRTRVRAVVVDGLARGGVCRPLRLDAA